MASESKSPYAVARDLIDAAHRRDPAYLSRTSHAEDVDAAAAEAAASSSSSSFARTHQDELSYADGVESWCLQLLSRDATTSTHLSNASPGGLDLVRLAARCQHLERFLTPRSTFPEGKMGYLKWRKHLYFKQAERARELLTQAGISAHEADLVYKWVSKTDLQPGKSTGDPGTQLLEDAAVLVFLQDQLADFAAQHQDYTKDKYISILSKTWRKLSTNAKAAAATIPLEEPLKGIVAEATEEIDRKMREDGEVEAPSSQSTIAHTAPAAPSRKYDHTALRAKSLAEAEAMLARSEGAEEEGEAVVGTSPQPPPPPQDSAPHSATTFGSRLLTDPSSYKSHNAWDHVQPPASYLEHAASLLRTQAETRVPLNTQEELYHASPASHWDKFYSSHENKFFKDRKWLGNEFPELQQLAEGPHVGPASIFEIGCGAGNTVFPLLQRNANPHLHIYACDYSAEAVGVVRNSPEYAEQQGKVTAFVWDLSSSAGPPTDHIPTGSLDIIVLIFVLSALHPREWSQAVANCHAMLKPGGLILFRDYGRYDLPQLRFKKGRMLDENFYVRGDGTRVYFFTQEELLSIFRAGRPKDKDDEGSGEADASAPRPHPRPLFDTVQLAEDRRMLVNRKEDKQMYRCWMQAKFVKRPE